MNIFDFLAILFFVLVGLVIMTFIIAYRPDEKKEETPINTKEYLQDQAEVEHLKNEVIATRLHNRYMAEMLTRTTPLYGNVNQDFLSHDTTTAGETVHALKTKALNPSKSTPDPLTEYLTHEQ